MAQELEWDDRGLRLCASEEPNDLAKRKVCVVDWERSRDLFARYVANAQRQQTGEADGLDAFFNQINPFKVHPMSLIGNCGLSQIFAEIYDFRRIWTCIQKYDPSVANWDAI